MSCSIPMILKSKILYKYKGINTPTASIINEHIKNYNNDMFKCWYCKVSINNVSLRCVDKSYINHQNLTYFQEQMLENEKKIMLCWKCAH